MDLSGALELAVEIVTSRPLSIRCSLRNPPEATRPQLVPRTLEPLGLFVMLTVVDDAGRVVFETDRAKAKLKLHPDRAECYLAVEPGDAFGVVFEVPLRELDLGPGRHRVEATYTNGPFVGPEESPIGVLELSCEVSFDVPARS